MTEEAKGILEDRAKLGQLLSEHGTRGVAKLLGISRDNVRYYARKYGLRGQETVNPLPTVQDRVAEERRRALEQEQKRELQELVSKRAQIEVIRDAIRDAGLRTEIPPLLNHRPPGGPYDEEFPVLFLSDMHIGQDTDARVNSGFAISMGTARRQVDKLIRTVVRLWDIRHRVVPWRHLTIIGLGDYVEGALRAAQHRQAAPVAEQAVMAGIALSMILTEMLRIFESVTFVSVPGNHGRVSNRPGVAGLDEVDPINSWDWIAVETARGILGQLNGDHVSLTNRLKIVNHASYIAKADVAGWPIVFEHGSSIKGGSYGGVPFYPVDRAAKNVPSLIAPAELEGMVDENTASYLRAVGGCYLFAIGHFHRPTILPKGGGWVVMNGSFPPTTPFVSATQHQALQPVQWLISLHPRKGMTMNQPIYLDLPEWKGLVVSSVAEPRFGEMTA